MPNTPKKKNQTTSFGTPKIIKQSGKVWKIHSKAHWFSLQTSSSSSGVKSFLMLNVLRISSRVLSSIMSAIVWQVKSSKFLMFKWLTACNTTQRQMLTHKRFLNSSRQDVKTRLYRPQLIFLFIKTWLNFSKISEYFFF